MGMAGILFGILFLSLFIGVPIGNLPWSCCFSDNDAHQQRTVSGIYSRPECLHSWTASH